MGVTESLNRQTSNGRGISFFYLSELFHLFFFEAREWIGWPFKVPSCPRTVIELGDIIKVNPIRNAPQANVNWNEAL